MNIFAKIQKWAALIGLRQASAPDISTTESAIYFDTDGKPKLVIGASPDTVHHIPKSQSAGHEITLTTTNTTNVTLPTSGTLCTEAVADSKDTAAIGAHNLSSGVHGVSGTLVGTTDSMTLTNKKLSDTTTTIVDVVDATKAIALDAAGSTGTKTTIASSQTTDRVITLPDATGTAVLTDAQQILTNKDVDGGTASNANRLTVPKNTTSNLAGLTRKEATLVYDSTTKKLNIDDGSALKVVGGGLIPVSLGLGNFTGSPKKYAAESGKLYLVDMDGAAEQYTITAPDGAAEVNFAVQVKNNENTTYRLAVEGYAGTDQFYYNDTAQTPLYFGYAEMRVDFAWDSNDSHFLCAVSQTPVSGTFGGDLNLTGTLTANKGVIGVTELWVGSGSSANQNITATSASNLPTPVSLTFTAPVTGKYKVYCTVLAIGPTGSQMTHRISYSAGSAIYQQDTQNCTDSAVSTCPYVLITLTKDVSYTFNVQSWVASGTGAIRADRCPMSVISELIEQTA